MKYDSIPFELIEPSNLAAIAEGTRRIGELTASPLWTSTYNTFAADNKVNVEFFTRETLAENGVPVELAKMMAKAVRDAFQAGSNSYMNRIGAAILTEDEMKALLRANEEDILCIFSVLCSAYQVGHHKENVPEFCFCAALVAGQLATEGTYQYQTRPAWRDPLADYPLVEEMRQLWSQYPAATEFASFFFKDQCAMMLSGMTDADSNDERIGIARTFGEATFAIGLTLEILTPDIKAKDVREIGEVLGNPVHMIAVAKSLNSSDTETLVKAQSPVLEQVYAAMGNNLLSPITFCQLLFVAGIDYGLSLRDNNQNNHG